MRAGIKHLKPRRFAARAPYRGAAPAKSIARSRRLGDLFAIAPPGIEAIFQLTVGVERHHHPDDGDRQRQQESGGGQVDENAAAPLIRLLVARPFIAHAMRLAATPLSTPSVSSALATIPLASRPARA